MNAAYLFRLACLSLASFFLVNGIAGAATALLSSTAIRIAETMRPRSAARVLFILRMLPSVLAMMVVLGLCVPSYLWLEPQFASERVGLACLLLTALAGMACSHSLIRTARAINASVRLRSEWLRSGLGASLNEKESHSAVDQQAMVVSQTEPVLALSGIFRPRMIISRGVLEALSKEQLDVAARHETAHRDSHDNLKRLFLVLSPEFFPCANGFAALEKTWVRFSEWAADDEAVQEDSQRALSLATALLRVARMGAQPRLSILQTSLLPEDQDLSARVDRLLCAEALPIDKASHTSSRPTVQALFLAVCAAALVGIPVTLSSVHRLLELFFR